MSNFKDSEFFKKVKRVCANRSVVVTFVTLLVALGVVIAVTVSANRARLESPNGNVTGNGTSLSTEASSDGQNVWNGEETLPTYNAGETDTPVNGNGEPEKLSFALPVSAGVLAKEHDPTIQVYSATMGDYRVHLGIDIATDADAPVCAIADGKVSRIWDDSLMGTCVAVTHDNDTVSIYKNLAKDLASGISADAEVKKGQQLGCVGETAIVELADEPHLHLEMTVGGISVDPMEYFSAEDVKALSEDMSFESGK